MLIRLEATARILVQYYVSCVNYSAAIQFCLVLSRNVERHGQICCVLGLAEPFPLETVW
jgi:hypothetical protein